MEGMRKMEAKGRKMLALGIVAMLCAVAIIGIGYAAAFGGTAKTYNDNNVAEAQYLSLSPGTDGSAWNAISSGAVDAVFDEYTYNDSGTKYAYSYIDGTVTTDLTISAVTYKSVQLGTKTFIVGNETGAATTSVTISVKASDLVGNADYVYILKVGAADPVILDNTGSVTAKDFVLNLAIADGETANVAVTLYIGYQENVYLPNADGDGFRHGAVITTTAYDALDPLDDEDAEVIALYDDEDGAHGGSANVPQGFTGLSLMFKATAVTA